MIYSEGAQGRLPEDMPSTLMVERWFARTYNWPADVTRRQPVEVIDWFPVIETAQARVDRMREREERRKHGQ